MTTENPVAPSTRRQLAAKLAEELGDTFTIVDHPDVVDDPADRIEGVIVGIRERIAPGPVRGSLQETHQLWLLDPLTDRAASEDALDLNLNRVLAVLEDAEWCSFTEAARDTFDQTYPAYRITLEIVSKLTP